MIPPIPPSSICDLLDDTDTDHETKISTIPPKIPFSNSNPNIPSKTTPADFDFNVDAELKAADILLSAQLNSALFKTSNILPTRTLTYHITGESARVRILPLLHSLTSKLHPSTKWCSFDPFTKSSSAVPDFVWENNPTPSKLALKWLDGSIRPKVFNHLPCPPRFYDSKATLSNLSDDILKFGGGGGVLPSVCVSVTSTTSNTSNTSNTNSTSNNNNTSNSNNSIDLTRDFKKLVKLDDTQDNMFVVKDAGTNGAGGVWVVNETNLPTVIESLTQSPSPSPNPNMDEQSAIAQSKAKTNEKTSTISKTNTKTKPTYVMQQYTPEPMLFSYKGSVRKSHIRMYALLSSSPPYAHLHNSHFLHLANRPYSESHSPACNNSTSAEDGGIGGFNPQIHLTNCCMNDGDRDLFSGEICRSFQADLTPKEQAEIKRVVGAVGRAYAKYSGGSGGGGGVGGGGGTQCFEFVGLDLSLSDSGRASVLELNAPPSLDTAYPHLEKAEAVHDEVHKDLLEWVVLPKVMEERERGVLGGGWVNCSEPEQQIEIETDNPPPQCPSPEQ